MEGMKDLRTHDPRTLAAEQECDRLAGEAVRTLRLQTRLSVPEAARKGGVDAMEWADHEAGLIPIPITRVPAIAIALGMEPWDLIRLLLGDASIHLLMDRTPTPGSPRS